MNLTIFNTLLLHQASTQFFKEELKISFGAFDSKPFAISDFFKKTPLTPSLQAKASITDMISDIYLIGIVNDEAFQNLDNAQNLDNGLLQTLSTVAKEDYQGLLLCAIQLKNPTVTRSQLAEITRLVNRQFPYLPVTIIFKYGDLISLANTERTAFKQEWREGEKVGKVSLLKDISLTHPHSGHLRILVQMQIARSGKNEIKTFEGLYKHWQSTFSISTLNKEFYQKLFNWYLYAQSLAKFPQIRPEADNISDAVHTSESLIRLLTRILFVWFMKEKGLINNDLFDKNKLAKILKSFKPDAPDATGSDHANNTYYKAILQNLFFATLNKPINERAALKKGWNPSEYADPLIYRYAQCFVDEDNFIAHFQNIPFLNGGLFDCLDSRKTDTQIEIRLDGFSSKTEKQANLPDKLFFGEFANVDFSSAYDDKSKNHQTVYGLVDILHQYKFTIEENTPREEEIALDPELLGKVFENLLASYNPETKTTARKQTGSFYTPREIVDYMVDESLKAYLSSNLQGFQNLGGLHAEQPKTYLEFGKSQTDLFGNQAKKQLTLNTEINLDNGLFQTLSTVENRLNQDSQDFRMNKINQNPENQVNPMNPDSDSFFDQLFSYQHTGNPFDPTQTRALLEAISNCKILDPACGSGAFPMGVLQKLIFVLAKLDPDNLIWLDMVVEKLPPAIRATMRQKLLLEDLNYVRKLGIIQECIYGVDIQPIATQIAKLRFFISLLVDQKEKPEHENRGFEPLPNLDFKIVTANTLIHVPKNEYAENKAEAALVQFETLTTDYFNAHTPANKKKLKAQIETCVDKIVTANQAAVDMFVKDIAKKKNDPKANLKKLGEQQAEFEHQLTL